MESISEAVKGMNVNALNAFITRLTFRYMLLKRAYTRCEFEEMLSHTKFSGVQIEENLIGLEILLSRPGTDFLSWAYFTLNGAPWQVQESSSAFHSLAVGAAARA